MAALPRREWSERIASRKRSLALGKESVKPTKRIRRKSTPAQVDAISKRRPGVGKFASRGHYDSLRIGRRATLKALRRAYRERALRTHPDKGGNVEDFRAVLAAFEVLSNQEKRSEYDSDLKRGGCSDGMGWSDDTCGATADTEPALLHADSLYVDACRTAFAIMKAVQVGSVDVTPLSTYEKLILQSLVRQSEAGVSDTVLPLVAHAEVREKKEEGEKKYAKGAKIEARLKGRRYAAGTITRVRAKGCYDILYDNGHKEQNVEGRFVRQLDSQNREVKKADTNVKYITYSSRDQNYFIQIMWRHFRVQTQGTRSLEQAIDWQIALMGMQVRALHRMDAMPPEKALEADPLTEDELMEAMIDQPGMRLTFGSVLIASSTGSNFTPFTRSLPLALEFRRRITKGSLDKADATQQVRRNNVQRVMAYAGLLKLVDEELLAYAAEREHLDQARDVALSLQNAMGLDQKAAYLLAEKLNTMPQEEVERRTAMLRLSLSNGEASSSSNSDTQKEQQIQLHAHARPLGVHGRRPTSAPSRGSARCPTTSALRLRSQTGVGLPLTARPALRSASGMAQKPNSILGRSGEVADAVLAWLTFDDLDMVSVTSACMKRKRIAEMFNRLRSFRYDKDLFNPVRRYSSRRASRATEPTPRLVAGFSRFLIRFATAFEELQLHKTPCAVLESDAIVQVLGSLPHAARMTFPAHGWSCNVAKKRLLHGLKHGVAYEFWDDADEIVSYGSCPSTQPLPIRDLT